tara:strand:+ start:168 stop:431 length:264 start_codon:yes stop_codon:yes gene_type:complete
MKNFKEFRKEITEVSRYDVRNYRWPTVEFSSSSYANDAEKLLLKKNNWKSYDNFFRVNGSKIEFSSFKINEPKAKAAFKKALGFDLR